MNEHTSQRINLPHGTSAATKNRRCPPQTSGWPGMVLTLLLTCGGCSLLIDREASQCSTDQDCVGFEGYPYCQGGLCVQIPVGPTGCFEGDPTKQNDLFNQCSAVSCVSFDNCVRLGICKQEKLPALPPPPTGAEDLGASTADSGVSGDE